MDNYEAGVYGGLVLTKLDHRDSHVLTPFSYIVTVSLRHLRHQITASYLPREAMAHFYFIHLCRRKFLGSSSGVLVGARQNGLFCSTQLFSRTALILHLS